MHLIVAKIRFNSYPPILAKGRCGSNFTSYVGTLFNRTRAFQGKSLVAIQKGIFLSHELVSNILYQKKNWIKIVSCTLLYRTVLYVYFVTENWDAYSQVNHFPFLHLIQILYLEMANIIKICLNKRYTNIRFKLQFEAIKLSAYYENYG